MASPTEAGAEAAPPAQLSPSEKFFRYFQHEVTDLQEQMARISKHSLTGGERSDAIDHCLSSIARLSGEVQDASAYVPAYDQRTYGEAIKALNNKLQEVRQSHAPKPKFSFKSKNGPLFSATKNESAISLNDAAEIAHQQRLRAPPYTSDLYNNSSMPVTPANDSIGSEDESTRNKGANMPNDTLRFRQPSFSTSKSVEISDHDDIHVVLPTAASHATSSGTVSNIGHCVVDLSQPAADKPFAALYLKNISSSLIICGHVSGATMLTKIKDSVILVATRQFRMHDSSNCDVYLLATSRPIIEDCSSIRFAPLPQTYMLEADRAVENKWSDVDDFKWLMAEQSPNWSVMAPGQRAAEKVWKEVVPGGPETSVQNVLDAVNVPRLR
ncbi:hypothetical protein CERZMDRAFT_71806 [Cercospora zeae-maydis SCOH1-5]|uniref:C-CAP/cofactor C-like domain-containing protein n=1 Tax=Cercospora zeae-maydis SCOH1-5 TaxID=717836 RepID=A0A6A6EZU7_9PEZI|nr:hypothetical protein CERZMDRAFT_71806 [Cercospora zeae-maydis SCOH1-5]